MSDTPETDAEVIVCHGIPNGFNAPKSSYVSSNFARKLERERDEAREELADWQDSAKNVRKEYEDEQHCSCVPILRKLLKDAESERDEARAHWGTESMNAAQFLSEKTKAIAERDEARAERDLLKLNAQSEAEHHDRMVGELERLYDKNSKLESMLDRAIDALGWFHETSAQRLQEELNQIKEGAK